jgi:hypothetical protein
MITTATTQYNTGIMVRYVHHIEYCNAKSFLEYHSGSNTYREGYIKHHWKALYIIKKYENEKYSNHITIS